MSDTQEALKNASQDVTALQRRLESEVSQMEQKKSEIVQAVPGRKNKVEECLARAQGFYQKSEWERAFAEWDKACGFLEKGDEFRKKIEALKASHQNLVKATNELTEIKTILKQRSAPSAASNRFVQNAHNQVSGQVKNAYSYISRELRTEYAPGKLSFRRVVLAVLLIIASAAGLYFYQLKTREAVRRQAAQNALSTHLQLAVLQSEREELEKKVAKLEDENSKKDKLIAEVAKGLQ